jgi:signal transduction histidine kinase/DNA-binding NarL/FixJ family response regulator
LDGEHSAPAAVQGSAYALQSLVGIETLKHSARLAGLAGGVLLLLIAGIAWLGTSATRLDAYWLAWASLPAIIAAFGGPWVAGQLLSRRFLTRWRLALLVVMIANATAWAFASAVAVSAQPANLQLLVVAWLALSVSLLPSLSWLPGLIVQLLAQLALTIAFGLFTGTGLNAYLLPLGLWVSLAFLALLAGIYARRVDLVRADAHYLRFESAELQHQLSAAMRRLDEASESRRVLEAELAEILNLAEDANRAKTEFLATMSHEIRTPLNGILPILEMLRETRLDREQQKLIRTAQGSSRHLLRIINDILDFAKVESGKLQLEAIEIDVRELVGSVTDLMGSGAKNQNLKLSASVAENVPQVVRGDPIRLRQILINLVSNAIKFTEEGGIRVEVSRGQSSQKEVELLFAVADTGVGMSQETTDRLFQLFTQADASTTRKHGGTGLGLVICKRLVELMGGKIGVRSNLGQGSTFWFLVPLRKSVMEVPSARRDLKGVRLLTLIADEDVAARVSANLRGWGVIEEATRDPQQAIATLRSSALLGGSWGYELALIDGDGLEARLPQLLADIRAIEELRRLNIVVSVRSETLAHKLKRDYGALSLADIQRQEPLRRLLHRLFDVETRRFGGADLKLDEVYDDLNVSAADLAIEDEDALRLDGGGVPRVLLVEDNPVNRGVVKKALSLLGVDCETATDGREAVERFEQGHYEMIFMDCQMPVMDGYEATGQIRQLEKRAGRSPVPIIAMTANAMEGDREKCIAAGMDDYLAKPVSLEQLRICVSDWLRESSRASPPLPVMPPAAVKPAAVTQPPVLDQKVLAELRDIMEEDYLRLLGTYLGSAPKLVAEAAAALARGDTGAMVIPVHSLKSSSANVGAMRLSALAREAERLARGGDLAGVQPAFASVESAFEEARLALKAHVDTQRQVH